MNNYFQLLKKELKNDFDWISPLVYLPINSLNTKTNFESRLIKFKFVFHQKIHNYILYKHLIKIIKLKLNYRKCRSRSRYKSIRIK